jgi:uncharacterized damage-inducible protein DinB
MDSLRWIRRLFEHASWADAKLEAAVHASAGTVPEALREYSHVVGTAETWLARIERRPPASAVWPDVSEAELRALRSRTEAAYTAYLEGLDAGDLERLVSYTNSAGEAFTNTVGDILTHVVLHGQYHRGKVNSRLRQAGHAPAAADYVAYVRGAPAATEETSGRDPRAP